MKNIQEITSQITNHKTIIHLMETILEDIDPDYPSEKVSIPPEIEHLDRTN